MSNKLAQSGVFKDLKPDELERLSAGVVQKVYPARATVFVGGQVTDGLYIIGSGRVKVLVLYPDGREKTLVILGPGEILCELTIFGSELRSATVETLETTSFLVLARENFHALMGEVPGLACALIEVLSGRLRRANRQIEELTFLNARSRVICILLHLGEEHGRRTRDGTKIQFSLTHEELARAGRGNP